MLKTNNKKVRERIRQWIMENYDACGYDEDSEEARAETFEERSKIILKEMKRIEEIDMKRRRVKTWQDAFHEWACTLPSLLNTADYVYCHSAIDILGNILEQTEEQRNKYCEMDAEKLMSNLIYSELIKTGSSVLY